MNDFMKNFCDLLEDTDPATINSDTEFKNIDEWSSLLALSLIAMVDENYDVTLGAEEIRKANTLGDLFEIIQSK